MQFSMGLSDVPHPIREKLFNDDGHDSIAVARGENAQAFVSLHPQTNYTTATVTVVFGTSIKSLMGFGLKMIEPSLMKRLGEYACNTFALVLADVLSDYYLDFIRDQADLVAPKANVSISSNDHPASVSAIIDPATRNRVSPDGNSNMLVTSEFMFRSTEKNVSTFSLSDEDRNGRALRYAYGDIGVTMGSSVVSDSQGIRRRMRERMKGHFHMNGFPHLQEQIKEFSILLYDGAEDGEDTPDVVRTKYPNLDDLIATGETFDIDSVLEELLQASDASASSSRQDFITESVGKIANVVRERNRLLWYIEGE